MKPDQRTGMLCLFVAGFTIAFAVQSWMSYSFHQNVTKAQTISLSQLTNIVEELQRRGYANSNTTVLILTK